MTHITVVSSLLSVSFFATELRLSTLPGATAMLASDRVEGCGCGGVCLTRLPRENPTSTKTLEIAKTVSCHAPKLGAMATVHHPGTKRFRQTFVVLEARVEIISGTYSIIPRKRILRSR